MTFSSHKIVTDKLAKSYGHDKTVFGGISLALGPSQTLAVSGPNGSGKSTLIKIIAGMIKPTSGKSALEIEGREIAREKRNGYISLVAPYLNLYEEFSPSQLFALMRKMRGFRAGSFAASGLLESMGLAARADDPIRTFSSGMKQKIKFCLAFSDPTPVKLLDEPGTNLDREAVSIVRELIGDHVSKGGSVIIATNQEEEIAWCGDVISLVRSERKNT